MYNYLNFKKLQEGLKTKQASKVKSTKIITLLITKNMSSKVCFYLHRQNAIFVSLNIIIYQRLTQKEGDDGMTPSILLN